MNFEADYVTGVRDLVSGFTEATPQVLSRAFSLLSLKTAAPPPRRADLLASVAHRISNSETVSAAVTSALVPQGPYFTNDTDLALLDVLVRTARTGLPRALAPAPPPLTRPPAVVDRVSTGLDPAVFTSVLVAAQGGDSELIRFNTSAPFHTGGATIAGVAAAELQPGRADNAADRLVAAGISLPIASLALQAAEVGYLARRVAARTVRAPAHGAVGEALAAWAQARVHKILAQVLSQAPTAGRPTLSDLHRLAAVARGAVDDLRATYHLLDSLLLSRADASPAMHGCQLLARLHELAATSAAASDAVGVVGRVIDRWVRAWLTAAAVPQSSALPAPARPGARHELPALAKLAGDAEFFILDVSASRGGEPVAASAEAAWTLAQGRFFVNPHQRCAWLPQEIEISILQAGRALAFARACRADFALSPAATETVARCELANVQSINQAVNAVNHDVWAEISSCLFERHRLLDHACMIHRHIFLADAAFASALSATTGPLLQRPWESIVPSELTAALTAALAETCPPPRTTVGELYGLVPIATAATADEIAAGAFVDIATAPDAAKKRRAAVSFALRYHVDRLGPLGVCWSAAAVHRLDAAARMAWAIRDAETATAAAMVDFMYAYRVFGRGVAVSAVGGQNRVEFDRMCGKVRELAVKVSVFIKNMADVCSHVSGSFFGGLQSAWTLFAGEAVSANDTDALVTAHEQWALLASQEAFVPTGAGVQPPQWLLPLSETPAPATAPGEAHLGAARAALLSVLQLTSVMATGLRRSVAAMCAEKELLDPQLEAMERGAGGSGSDPLARIGLINGRTDDIYKVLEAKGAEFDGYLSSLKRALGHLVSDGAGMPSRHLYMRLVDSRIEE